MGNTLRAALATDVMAKGVDLGVLAVVTADRPLIRRALGHDGFAGSTKWQHARRSIEEWFGPLSTERDAAGESASRPWQDRDHAGSGRSYPVERELEQDGYAALKALVADYTQQARELGKIPMASSLLAHQREQDASAVER